MPRRNPPAKWTLPDVIDPVERRCITIEIPNEKFHIAAFWGALWNLASAYKWQDDPAHTAKSVALVWKTVIDNVVDCSGVPLERPIFEDEYQMAICEQLRFLNGKLQGYCCGEWVDIPGQEGLSIGGSGQPGGGSTQPTPGGCTKYHGSVQASGQWLLPTPVSAGDTLAFSNASGTGWDGGIQHIWRCPDGHVYFAGLCGGGLVSDGGDPDPAIPHMALIAQIGGVWYSVTGGTITVPAGVDSAQVVVQVNDATLSDNAGGYDFDVEVCNNQTPPATAWCYTVNLKTVNIWEPYGAGQGEWVSGQGVVTQDANIGGYNRRILQGYLNMPGSANLTKVTATYNYTLGNRDSNDAVVLSYGASCSTIISRNDVAEGNNQTVNVTCGGTDTRVFIEIQVAIGTLSGLGEVTAITFEGTGANPFGASNC